MADIRSEPRPASDRNRWPASDWNAWPASSESAMGDCVGLFPLIWPRTRPPGRPTGSILLRNGSVRLPWLMPRRAAVRDPRERKKALSGSGNAERSLQGFTAARAPDRVRQRAWSAAGGQTGNTDDREKQRRNGSACAIRVLRYLAAFQIVKYLGLDSVEFRQPYAPPCLFMLNCPRSKQSSRPTAANVVL